MAIFRLKRSSGGSRLNGTAQDRVRSGSPVTPYSNGVTTTAPSVALTLGNEVAVGGAYRKFTAQYRTGGEYLDLYVPAGAPPSGGWPVVQFAHSGSFYQGARGINSGNGFTTAQLNALIAAKYVVADCDYTLTGEPQAFTQQGLTHPVGMWSYKAAGAWLRDTAASRYQLNASKILATGYSAGGHIAFEAALTREDSTARSYPDNADGDRSYGWRAALTLPLESPYVTTDPTYAGVFMWSAPISVTLEYGASAGASAACESLVGHTLGEAVYGTEADLNSYISNNADGFYGTTTHYPTFPIGYSWTTSDGLLNSTGATDALYTVMGEVGYDRPAVGTITATGLTRFSVAASHDNALISADIDDFIAWADAVFGGAPAGITTTAPAATLSAAATAGVSDGITTTAPAVTVAAAATAGASDGVTTTAPAVTLSAAATAGVSDGITTTAPVAAFSRAATASSSDGVTTTAPAATLAAAATAGVSDGITTTAPAVSLTANATVAAPGGITTTAPAVSLTANATAGNTAAITTTAPRFIATLADGIVDEYDDGYGGTSVSVTTGPVTTAPTVGLTVGAVSINGAVTTTAPSVTLAANATVQISDGITTTAPAATMAANATASGPGGVTTSAPSVGLTANATAGNTAGITTTAPSAGFTAAATASVSAGTTTNAPSVFWTATATVRVDANFTISAAAANLLAPDAGAEGVTTTQSNGITTTAPRVLCGVGASTPLYVFNSKTVGVRRPDWSRAFRRPGSSHRTRRP